MAEITTELDNASVLEEMAKAGVLYGRKKSKTNPKMFQYIQGVRNGIEIFDLTQTLSLLEMASASLKELSQKGGKILLVGTQPAAKEIIKSMADKFSFPYVAGRWLGGTLTNFKTLSGRIAHYIKLKNDRATGSLEKYTKKERLGFDREIARMENLFGGLETMDRLPDVLLIVDGTLHEIAIREANRLGIPVIAIMNSDGNPEAVKWLITANSFSKTSIQWIMERLTKAIEEGKK